MTKLLFRSVWLLLFTAFQLSSQVHANGPGTVWQDVKKGNSIIILRHALAPGNGDPSNFDINNCDTQRNLSTEGRLQALRIGKMLKSHDIDSASIYTSQWCRCIDTALAMELDTPTGTPLENPELNSFYNNPQAGPAQIKKLTQWLSQLNTSEPLVLVTHQVVITALTGVYPASGEAVIFSIINNTINVEHRVKTK